MFSIYRVEKDDCTAIEPLGTKTKYWYDNSRKLFKAEDRDTGEDWAEKIACHLCELLNLPHVHYELADLYHGNTREKRGVICENCATSPLSLILGNQCLFGLDPNYPVKRDRYKVREHTVCAVAEFLKQIESPNDFRSEDVPSSNETALDIFVGYVMLDAWIANQDRHHENWGVLLDKDRRFLAAR
jgi:hypothetical protein